MSLGREGARRRRAIQATLADVARAMLRGFVVLCAAAVGCGGTERVADAPRHPVAAKDAQEAARLRARGAELAREGRIARAGRLLARADALAPDDGDPSRVLELELLTELGRQKEALALAAKVLASPSASDAAKAAARRARAAIWPTVDGLALARDGLAKKAAGSFVEARRTFDRAVDALERKTEHAMIVTPLSTTAIERVRWSPDGTKLSVVRGVGVEIVDGGTGALLHAIAGHVESASAAPFHPKKPLLATCGYDGAVNLWDVDAGRLVRSFDREKLEHATFAYYTCEFSVDGQLIAAGGAEGVLKVWNTETGALVHASKDHKGFVRSLAWSPDGTSLVTGSDGGPLLRRVGSWEVLARLENDDSFATLSFDPERPLLFAGGNKVHVLDAKTLTSKKTLSARTTVKTLVALRGGAVFASTADGVRELTSGRVVQAPPVAFAGPMDVTADGRHLATVSEDKKNVVVVDLPELPRSKDVRLEWPKSDTGAATIDGKVRWRHTTPRVRPLSRVTVSPGGQTMAAISEATLYAWRLDGRPVRKNERVVAVGVGVQDECDYAFSPDGESVVSVGGGKEERATLHLRRLDGDDKSASKIAMVEGTFAQSVAFAPDGGLIAALSGTTTATNVTFFSPATGERTGMVVTDGTSTQTLNCVGFGAAHTVHWQEETKTVVYDLRAKTRADFPPGTKLAARGTLLAVGVRSAIDLWDTAAQRHLRVFDLPAWITSVAFGAGDVLAASAGGKTLIWPLHAERRADVFWSSVGGVDSLSFHPGGKAFATSGDGEVRIWSLATRSLRASVVVGEKDLFVIAPTGHVEATMETARERVACVIGSVAVPLELCEDRFFEPYLLEKIVHGDDSYLER